MKAVEKEKGGIRFIDYGASTSSFNIIIPSLF
jgi:hypothetical protein